MTLIYILLLLGTNAFFVAAEFALVKVPAIRVQSQAAEGDLLARVTLTIHNRLEAYLAVCQLGITMASLGLGWIGEPAVAALLWPAFEGAGFSEQTLHTISFLTGFILFSSLHIVIGEQVPKSYAIRRADRVSYLVALPLIACYWIAFPLNWLLNKSSALVLRALGVKEVSHVDVMTGAEISGLIDVSRDHGAIEVEKASMLQNLFAFDERSVERIMLPRSEITYLDYHCTAEQAIATLRNAGHSRLPVIDQDWDQLKGIVLIKELLFQIAGGHEGPLDLDSIMREAQLVPETQPIRRLFDQMRRSREHLALAVDEYGDISGLVTLEDLLEEIVGDIKDELDRDHEEFAIREAGSGWLAHGLLPLGDVERVTGYRAGDASEANTLSGLIMLRLEKIPEPGDCLEENGYRFTVTDVDGSRVESVQIERIAPPAPGPVPDRSGL